MPGCLRTFTVVIPVYNEIDALRHTVPALLDGLPPGARLVYVCNGCSDSSADFLLSITDNRLRVLETSRASKTLALAMGEEAEPGFPRFFVDADVLVSGAVLAQLADLLGKADVELVSPRLTFDHGGASLLARKANEVWLSLPHGEQGSFQQVIGVNRQGRARWGAMPEVTADDSFIAAQVPTERRHKAMNLAACVRPPATLPELFGTRLRILKGLAELEAMGIERPRAPGQKAALRRALLTPRTMPGALTYIATGLAARAAFALGVGRKGWYRDTSSRRSFAKTPPSSHDKQDSTR